MIGPVCPSWRCPSSRRLRRGVARGALCVALLATLASCERASRKAAQDPALPKGADPGRRQGRPPAGDPRIYHETRPFMGTLFRVTIALRGDPKTEPGRKALATSRRQAVEAARAVFVEVARVERLFSTYIADSPISRINQAAAKAPTKAVKVDQEVFNLLHKSLQVSRLSSGAFDITFGALGQLWKPRGGKPYVPTVLELRKAVLQVGYRYVKLDYEKNTVRLMKPGMRMGLGAVAKGYGVDMAVRVLRANKVNDFIVDGGGDLFVAGKHPERAWRVGIKDPRKPATHFASFDVKNRAVVTSGDYERFFMVGGKRYHHILDPRTGQPAQGLMSVTVVAPTAMMADALATATFVLGPRKGYAFVTKYADSECILVTKQGQVMISPGLRDKVKKREVTKGP